MEKKQMQEFLESKGIVVTRSEGDDFSAVFYVSKEDRLKAEQNQTDWESETGLMVAPSDMFGMNVVVMENTEG